MDGSTSIGAYALVHGDEPQLFLAEDEETMSRVLAGELIGQTSGSEFSSPERLHQVREALVSERWAEALAIWIDETGRAVDVYASEPKIWKSSDEQVKTFAWNIQEAPIFSD
jgi:hypothetical protein